MTGYLLDSHVFLWALAGNPRLSDETGALIADVEQRVLVSAATIWELEIKQAAGRLEIDGDLVAAVGDAGFEPLSITGLHAAEAARLPRHHADPFDRMLVAQARLDELILISADHLLTDYDVLLLRP